MLRTLTRALAVLPIGLALLVPATAFASTGPSFSMTRQLGPGLRVCAVTGPDQLPFETLCTECFPTSRQQGNDEPDHLYAARHNHPV